MTATPHDVGFDARSAELDKRGIALCTCSLCEEDRKDKAEDRLKRRELLPRLQRLPANFFQAREDGSFDEEVFYQVGAFNVREAEQTYADAHAPNHRFELAIAYGALGVSLDCALAASGVRADSQPPARTPPVRQDVCLFVLRLQPRLRERAKWADRASQWHKAALASCGSSETSPGRFSMPERQHDLCICSLLALAGVHKLVGTREKGPGWLEVDVAEAEISRNGRAANLSAMRNLLQTAIDLHNVLTGGGKPLWVRRLGPRILACGLVVGASPFRLPEPLRPPTRRRAEPLHAPATLAPCQPTCPEPTTRASRRPLDPPGQTLLDHPRSPRHAPAPHAPSLPNSQTPSPLMSLLPLSLMTP